MTWLKLHTSLLNNRRYHKLSDKASKALILLWCYCADQETIGECEYSIDKIMFALRLWGDNTESAQETLSELEESDFIGIDENENLLCICNWEKYQGSTNSTQRVRDYRKRQKANETLHETPCNINETICNVSETECNTLDKIRIEQASKDKSKNKKEASRKEQEQKMLHETQRNKVETFQNVSHGKSDPIFDHWKNPSLAIDDLDSLWKRKTGRDMTNKERDVLRQKIESGDVKPRVFERAINTAFARKTGNIPETVHYIYPIYEEICRKEGIKS